MADQSQSLDYIYDPLDEGADPDFLQQEAYDYIQSKWPDWVPSESNLETWLIAVCSRMIAEARDVATDVPRAIFRYFGTTVAGVPSVDATHSTVNSTWNLSTNPSGRTIAAGTIVNIDDSEGEPHAFEVVAPVVLGIGVLIATPVALRSLETGEIENDLGGNGVAAVNAEGIAWVTSIILLGATGGGGDGEDDEEYLNRLSARMTLLSPRPIVPKDFQLLTKDLAKQQGYDVRAMAIDGYDPNTATFNNERMITVAMVQNGTGADVPAPTQTIVNTQLQDLREVNFIVNFINPTRSTVDVTVVGHAIPGIDPLVTEADVESALASLLDPNNWGRGTGFNEWMQQTTVRHQDVSTAINNVETFDYWDTLTIGINGGAQAATDMSISGAAPIAQAGIISVTIT